MATNNSKLIGVKEASELTGLSATTLRRGAKSGRFHHTRTSTKHSKILFNEAVLLKTLRDELTKGLTEHAAREVDAVLAEGFIRTTGTKTKKTKKA